MTNGYKVAVTCPDCGRPLTHQAAGEPSVMVTQAVAVCTECAKEYIVRLTLTPCGTTRPDRDVYRHPVTATILAYEGNRRRSVSR